MARQGLTKEQCLLLQRYHDEELSAAESVEARQLLEGSASARVLINALEELTRAAREAAGLAWEQAEAQIPSPRVLTELAADAGDLEQTPLEDLAPLLERFHDGEADHAEMAFVRALLEERDDAVDYLAGLDEIGQSLRAAGEELADDVDFDGFWEKIADEIDDGEPLVFDRGEHLVLLHRYADGEVDADEARLVEQWIADGVEPVQEYLEVLAELELGVNVAVETACEQADLRGIWTGVDEAIAAEADTDKHVVSLDQARDQKSRERDDDRHSGPTTGADGYFGDYRQAVVGALAAALVLAGLVGLFKDQILGPNERVVVEKRVVIVEQVEYSPGSSVMIDSPMKQASAESSGEEDPTVIWLLDSGDEAGGAEPGSNEPSQGGDAGSSEEQDAGRDAGSKPAPQGQPI